VHSYSLGAVTIIYKRRPKGTTATDRIDVLSVWNFDGKLAFEDICTATENFSDRYIIGSGGVWHCLQSSSSWREIDCSKKASSN
jgi:hypothetical protein